MAGFGLGNYINPAVGGFIDQRRNALAGLGAGLLGGQPGAGVQQGIAADSAYAIQQKEQAEREKLIAEQQTERNQTTAWLKANFPQYANLPPAQGWQAAMGDLQAKRSASTGDNLTAEQRNWQYGQANPGFMDFLSGGQGDVTTGFTPIAGTINGKSAVAFPGNDGQFYIDGQPVQPGSFTPTNPYDLNALKAGGTMFGKQTGDAQFDVPSAKLTVDQTVDALKEIRDNKAGMAEQFGNIVGLPTQMIPARPGTAMADFRNSVERGANLAFMQAREMLRGGGQITDFESKKAESAITDMQIAMQSGSQPAFEKAMDDFEKAVKDGFTKLQAQASIIPGFGAGGTQPTGAPAGGGYTVLSVE
jgi:hypothetical protein